MQRVIALERYEQFDEIIGAIKDLNSLLRLEENFSDTLQKAMKKLRKSRADDEELLMKWKVAVQKLRGLSEDNYVKQEFVKRYGVGLLEKICEEIDLHIKANSTIVNNISEEARIIAENWWRRN
mmetsp:Transcript_27138/g.37404  ORF Transcript_27138/g.37404 Transcript_27138/m.37404 type:complete len:124 (-) Transcript_27138:53-424(-)